MKEEVKKKKLRRKTIIYVAAGILLMLLIARPVLNKIVENNVKEQLKQLAPLAIVGYSSIHADLIMTFL